MNWLPTTDYAIRTTDKRFAICRKNVGERIDYELWRVSGNLFLSARRGVKPDNKSRMTAINELKDEALKYVESQDAAQ